MKKNCFSLSALLLIATLCINSPLFAADQKTSSKSASKAPAADIAAEPISVEILLRAIDSIKKKRLKETRVLEIMDQHNLSFKATPDNLKILSDAGASPAVLAKVKELAPLPVAPPPPPKKPVYILMVKCAPAECEVRTNSDPFRSTTAGLAQFSVVGPQRLILDARRTGYEPQTIVFTIDPAKGSPNTPFEYSFGLQPSAATQATWGDQIMARMSGDFPKANQHTLSGVLAVGTTPVQQWKVSGQIGVKGDAELLFENNQGKYNVTCAAFICSRAGKSSRPSLLHGSKQEKADQEAFLLRISDAFIAQEYSVFAAKLTGSKTEARTVADPSKPLDRKQVDVKNGLGAYVILLDDGARPTFVNFAPSTNLTLISKTKYVNFRKLNDGWYPGTTEFLIPGDSRAIEFVVKDISSAK